MEIPSKKDMYYVILFYLLYHVREKNIIILVNLTKFGPYVYDCPRCLHSRNDKLLRCHLHENQDRKKFSDLVSPTLKVSNSKYMSAYASNFQLLNIIFYI